MTKGKLIELIRGYLAGGSVTQDFLHKVDPRRLELWINEAYSKLIYDAFRLDQRGLSLYTKTYTGIAITQDATTDIYESDLPASIIQLPGVASGIRGVAVDNGVDVEFVPVEAEVSDYITGLEVGDDVINTVIGYRPRGNKKVEFYNLPSSMASETGTADDGGSGTLLIRKTGTAFESSNIKVGDVIHNVTDGSWAEVSVITDDDNITTTQLVGGTGNTWAGDNVYLAPALRMDLVIQFSEYNESDDVYIPSGKNQEFFEMVLGLLMQRKPVETLSDNRE